MTNKKDFQVISASFDFGFVNLVNSDCEETVKNFVNYKLLTVQFEGLSRSLPKEDFEKAHPGCDFWTADESLFDGVVSPAELPDVLETRKNALAVLSALRALPVGLEDFNALSQTDRAYILIEAHKTTGSIILEKSMLEGVDFDAFTKMIERIYKNASVTGKDKDLIRSMVYRVMGKHGDLFTALAPTKGELEKKDIMHFVASFGGQAKRATKKSKDCTAMTPYDYILKGGFKAQSAALTTLIGVIMEIRKGTFCRVLEG